MIWFCVVGWLLCSAIVAFFGITWSRQVYTFASEHELQTHQSDDLFVYLFALATGPFGMPGMLLCSAIAMRRGHGRFRETPAEYNKRHLKQYMESIS